MSGNSGSSDIGISVDEGASKNYSTFKASLSEDEEAMLKEKQFYSDNDKVLDRTLEVLEKSKEEKLKKIYNRPLFWWMVFLFVTSTCTFTAAIIMQIFFSHIVSREDVPVYLWIYFVGVVVASFFVSRFIATFLISVGRISKFYEHHVYYYVHGSSNGLQILLSAIFPWIFWTDVLGNLTHDSNPYRNADLYIPKVFESFIIIGAGMVANNVISKILVGLQDKKYQAQITAILYLEDVLSQLEGAADMIPEFQNSPRSKVVADRLSRFMKQESATKLPAVRKMKVKDLQKRAEEKSKKIFERLDDNNTGTLTIEEFKKAIPNSQIAQNAFLIFDRDESGAVSHDEFTRILQEIYANRKATEVSLSDSQNIQDSLEEVVSVIIGLIVVFCILSIFGVNINNLIIALSSVLIAASFALGGVFTSLAYGIVMVFFVKPFNLGDRISIDKEDTIYIVQSIGLWTTDALDETGKRHYFHNGTLANEHIVNHTRTSRMEISMDLILHSDTPDNVIYEIKGAVTQLARNNPDIYAQVPCVNVSNVNTDTERITLTISCELAIGWYDPRKITVKQDLIDVVLKFAKVHLKSNVQKPDK